VTRHGKASQGALLRKSLLFQPFFLMPVGLFLLTSLIDLYNSTNVMVVKKKDEEPREAVPRRH
jgi:hypothetical protein